MNYFFIAATWLIGLLGVGGALAAIAGVCVLGPTAVTAIVEPVLKRFLECVWCIVAVAFLLSSTGAYWVGHHDAEKVCRADALAAELRNKQIDLDNAKKSEADQTDRANKIEADSNDQHAKDMDYIKSLEARPSCALDDGDIGRVPNHKPRFSIAKPAARAK